jgi:hypothetical protein
MRAKALILNIATITGTLGLAGFLVIVLPISAQPLAAIVALIVGIFLAIVRFAVLVCPYCKASAVLTPSGTGTPFVGTKCRYCHKEY